MSYNFDLGDYSWPITAGNRDAQQWFDRGLLWFYGFNREEAVHCFREAHRADPSCAMAPRPSSAPSSRRCRSGTRVRRRDR